MRKLRRTERSNLEARSLGYVDGVCKNVANNEPRECTMMEVVSSGLDRGEERERAEARDSGGGRPVIILEWTQLQEVL